MTDNWLSSPAPEQLTPFEAVTALTADLRSAHVWTRTAAWDEPASFIPRTVIFAPPRSSPSAPRQTLRH